MYNDTERARILKAQRDILNRCEAEGRDMSALEEQRYDKLEAQWDSLSPETQGIRPVPEHQLADYRGDSGGVQYATDKPITQDSEPFHRYLAFGEAGLCLNERAVELVEVRTTKQLDKDVQGGFMVSPEKFSNELLKAADNETYALSICRVHQVPDAYSFGMA